MNLTTTENISGHVAANDSVMNAFVLLLLIGIIGLLGNLIVVISIFRFTNLANKVTSINIINESLIDLDVAVLILLTAFIDNPFMPADDDVKDTMALCDERFSAVL